MPKTPSYRSRRGYSQAIVTLTDSATKERRDYWLGQFGTPASRECYHRLIAEWEGNGRRLPRATFEQPPTTTTSGVSVAELIRDYWRWASVYYGLGDRSSLQILLRLLRTYYGQTPAIDFGPNKARGLREAMIRGDQNADPPRRPWSRKYINRQMGRLRHLFKWAASRELVPVSVHQSLCTLEPLKRRRSEARETEKVGPVPKHLLDGVLPQLSRPVRAIVALQLHTGARPGELLGLRPCDIEMDEQAGIWTYNLETHKNAYCDKERIIYFGPQAQAIIRTFLGDRPTNAFLFRPGDADAERRAAVHASRKTPLSCGNRPGTNRRTAPRRKPGERYTTTSYCRAIQYACDEAFPPPAHLARARVPARGRKTDATRWETAAEWKRRLGADGWAELRAWRKDHRCHPHQLRHNAATLLRREFGLEAAQLALGHASAQITDAVYAERDRAKVIEIMRRIG